MFAAVGVQPRSQAELVQLNGDIPLGVRRTQTRRHHCGDQNVADGSRAAGKRRGARRLSDKADLFGADYELRFPVPEIVGLLLTVALQG